MRIVHGLPPNFDQIAAVFPAARQPGVIFTYGLIIYLSRGAKITQPLVRHEAVHGMRQAEDPAAWWDRYLIDPGFRLEEELVAHRVEWQAYVKRHGFRESMLDMIAGRLSGPLYGGMLSYAEARDAIVRLK